MLNRPTFKYALVVGDIACLSLAYFIALDIASSAATMPMTQQPLSAVYALLAYAICLPLLLFIYLLNDLYKLQTFRHHYHHLLIVAKSMLIGTAISASALVLFGWDFFSTYGREFLMNFLGIAFLLSAIARLGIVRMFVFGRVGANGRRRLLIVGSDDAAKKAVQAIQSEPKTFLVIAGMLDDYREPGTMLFAGWQNLGRLESITELAADTGVDEILIAIDKAPYPRLVNIVDACLKTGCVVRVFSDRVASLASRIDAEQYARDVPVIMLSQRKPGLFSGYLRRAADIVVATSALILLSPLFLAVSIGIKMSSPGPAIFRQTRVGLNGRTFEFYKFRSMHRGTSSVQHETYVRSFIEGDTPCLETGDAAAGVFKIVDDPRTFAFGRLIRRMSIDEFPQLVNVLKGDMSLISPRPCLPYEWEKYEDWHRQRLSVPPGCTGMWQVYGRSTVTFEDMVIMDLYYISNRSLSLDVRILFKTISVILFAKGGF